MRSSHQESSDDEYTKRCFVEEIVVEHKDDGEKIDLCSEREDGWPPSHPSSSWVDNVSMVIIQRSTLGSYRVASSPVVPSGAKELTDKLTDRVHLHRNRCVGAVLEENLLVASQEITVEEKVLATCEGTKSLMEPHLLFEFVLEPVLFQNVSSHQSGRTTKQGRTIQAVDNAVVLSLNTVVKRKEVRLDVGPDATLEWEVRHLGNSDC